MSDLAAPLAVARNPRDVPRYTGALGKNDHLESAADRQVIDLSEEVKRA
jgi:hypothetical protein